MSDAGQTTFDPQALAEHLPLASYTEAEQTFGDYTVPSQLRASWWAGTDREFEFLRASVDDIQYSA